MVNTPFIFVKSSFLLLTVVEIVNTHHRPINVPQSNIDVADVRTVRDTYRLFLKAYIVI